ncbi:hypothetical protein BH09ACT10_BH09ACT10_19160 [soil metagenome]
MLERNSKTMSGWPGQSGGRNKSRERGGSGFEGGKYKRGFV